MITIKIKIKCDSGREIVVCSVYLPSTNRSMAEIRQTLSALKLLCLKEKGDHNLIILGYFNAHITGERAIDRGNTRGRLVKEVLSALDLTAVNLISKVHSTPTNHLLKSENSYEFGDLQKLASTIIL